jgi:tight adherence protein B
MKYILLMEILAVPITGGIVATWLWAKRRERGTIAARLERFVDQSAAPTAESHPVTLLRSQGWSSSEFVGRLLPNLPHLSSLETTMAEAGFEQDRPFILLLLPALFILPPLLAFAFGLNILLGLIAGLILCVIPLVVVKTKAERRRTKFCEQLPDAIDLMVAVLRSGHSVPQAVKAVALEIPSPCGQEFETVLQRINLGQPLSNALFLSSKRFRSYELDLMRRAVSIQSEVGGSLADILDKTNYTLRQRLKMARQLRVITAQSRLSAWIVGLLPIVLAIILNIMSPGYLQILFNDPIGRVLALASLFLEGIGIVIMRRMSTMKV